MALITNMNLNTEAVPSVEDATPTFGEYLKAAASDAWAFNPTVALSRASDIFQSMHDMDNFSVEADAMEFGTGAVLGDNGKLEFTGGTETGIVDKQGLSIDDQKKMIKAAGLEGRVTPQEGYNADTLKLIFDAKHTEIDNAMTREKAPAWMAPFGFAVGLGVGFADPINLASGFMPVVSYANQLRRLQGAGGAAGRALSRAATGAIEGAVGAAAVEPIIQISRMTQQADYEMSQSLTNIAFGSIMGAAMHAGKGALGEWWRAKHGQRQEWEVAVPTDSTEALRRQMSEDIHKAAQDAGAEKLGKVEADAASAIFDLHARQWAYDMGKPVEDFYKDNAPVWKAGVISKAVEGGSAIRLGTHMFVGGMTEDNVQRGEASARIVDALEEARAQESAGAVPDDIAEVTGWRKGDDGKWKYEGEPDVLYMLSGGKDVQYGINVRNTKEHYVDSILDGGKTVETRTPRAWADMQRAGIKVGDRIAIVDSGVVKGFVTLADVVDYKDAKAFRADQARHLVPEGSKYDYAEGKGKVGLVFKDPERLADGVDVPKLNRPQGWRRIPEDVAREDEVVILKDWNGIDNKKGIDIHDKKQVVDFVSKLTRDNLPVIKFPKSQALDSLRAGSSPENWLKFAIDKVRSLQGKTITDPMGNKLYLRPGDGETLESYARHMIAGMNEETKEAKPLSEARLDRVLGLYFLEDTIKHPQIILRQEPKDNQTIGRKRYLSVYSDGEQMMHSVIVGVEQGEDGRIVTSFVTVSEGGNKNKALSQLRSIVRKAEEFLYIEEGVQSGHSRTPTGLDGSQGSAPLTAAGTETLNQNVRPVNKEKMISALEAAEDVHLPDKNALLSDLRRGELADKQLAIEEAVAKVREGRMDNGPDADDAVSGPALSYHEEARTLNQWQNIPEWQERLTNWMRTNGYTEEQIAAQVAGIRGQMTLYEALGAKISAEVVGAHQAEGGRNAGVKYSGPVRSNIDEIYVISFDLSSQCVKRLAAANTAAIAEQALGRPLRVEEQMALIALERAKGQEAPCVYCYVESNRAKARQAVGRARDLLETGNIPKTWGKDRKAAAQAAIDAFRAGGLKKEDINYNYVLDQSLRNTDAVAAIRQDPKYKPIYDYFDFEANATKQNQAKPYEEYTGELLDLTPDQVKMLNGYAGMRFFSTSDFQVEHVVDVIQAMWDMNALGLKSHGYTKVPLYVDIFGDTGQKINMSCFAKVDPKTGEIGMDSAQGWNWDLAKEYRQQHPDVGIIFVCANDKILNWAMNQDWIDYCIPFHYSGLEKQYYLQMAWQDFTSTQMESNIYATKRTRSMGFFDEAPVKNVTASEQRILKDMPVAEASVKYAELCFERRLYPVKPELFFKPELIEGANKTQRANAAKALWEDVLESGKMDPDMINPDYMTEYWKKGATTKEKTIDDISVQRVRMHEMKFTMPEEGTPERMKLEAWAQKNGVDLTPFEAGKTYSNSTGMPDWMGTFAYLELCKERRIYPVFVNFLFKGYEPAEMTEKMAAAAEKKSANFEVKNAAKLRKQAEADLAEYMVGHPDLSEDGQRRFVENRIRNAMKFTRMDNAAEKLGKERGKHVKLAKERWEDMVMSGEIDYDAINPNFFKVKKDYARTDTPFNVPDPRKINGHAASQPLRETIDQGLAVKYHGDNEVADQLVRLARFGEESGQNIGQASLRAIREGTHPMAAIMGEDAKVDRGNASSLWQRTISENYTNKQKRVADAMNAPRRAVEEEGGFEAPVEISEPEVVAKGRITFNATDDGRALIEFFKAADATTAPHELYHLFRRQMAETSADPNAPQRVKDMYQKACEFVGAEPGKAWTVEQEEKFARAGEKFLMEGVAPHPAVQDVFDRMKQWFTEAYNSAEEAGLEISDSMREVFKDMLMSPTIGEAGALYRYSLGKMLDSDPSEGADTNVELMGDNIAKPDAIADMQEQAQTRVDQSLDSLAQRLPEGEIEAFRKEYDEAMRAEDEAIAAVAAEDEMLREAAACDLRSL